MSKKTALKLTALAAALAASAVPVTAAAEISGSLAISNIYFWRGLDISGGGAAVSGSLDYGHESGVYAGVWTSSELGRTEYDLYAGFAGEVGDFSYDLSYWDYNYVGGGTDADDPDPSDADLEEVVIALGFAGVEAAAYLGVGEIGHGDDTVDNESDYFTLAYTYDKVTGKVGTWAFEDEALDYTHVDLSYALTDQFTFTASKIVDEDTDHTYSDDLLFVVSYSFAL